MANIAIMKIKANPFEFGLLDYTDPEMADKAPS